MGCNCVSPKQPNEEWVSERYQGISNNFKANANWLRILVRIQALIRGVSARKRFNITVKQDNHLNHSLKNPNVTSKFTLITNSKITNDEISQFFRKYPPLQDNKAVELRQSVEYENRAVYYGEWSQDGTERHGRGIQVWWDGSRYEGYWQNDKANVRGKLIHADGDIYEGEWREDKAHGYGVYTHIDGAKYEGYWRDDKQNGNGKESWPDGASYEGDYKEGKKCGKGKFKWSDNSIYEGEFSDNNINGKGIYTWGDRRKYIGDWKNNKMDGQGVFIWPDKRKYQGEYKDDKKKDLVALNGQMGGYTVDTGKMESKMGVESFITPPRTPGKKGFGKMGGEFNG